MRHRQQGRRFRAWLQVEQLEDRNLLSAGGLGDSPLAEIAVLPNDPSFGTQYALNNTGQSGGKVDADLDAPEAWKVTTGSTKNIIAIVDTGIDYRHPDLYQNLWINQGEIPSAIRARLVDVDGDGLITFRDLNHSVNQGAGKITDRDGDGRITGADLLKPVRQGGWADGVSNDGDKYVDDLIGWNFIGNNNNPFDDNGHGSHVAGIIGAMGNNGVGVAGLNGNVQLMALKFLASSGTGPVSGATEAINYAVAHGAFESNHSWSSQGAYYPPLADAIANARRHGHILVAAAGNGGSDLKGDNLDASPSYPASYNEDNVVAVAATDRRDALTAYSNYGARTVDLAAPGQNILSTWMNGRYVTTSGTSMATPMVAGTLALVRAVHPSWSYSKLINQVLSTVDKLPALAGKVASGGRVNAARAVGSGRADLTGPRFSLNSSSPLSAQSSSGSGAAASAAEATETSVATVLPNPGSPALEAVATPPAETREESVQPFCDYFNLPSQLSAGKPAGQQTPSEQSIARVPNLDAPSVATRLDRDAVDQVFAFGVSRRGEQDVLAEGDGLSDNELSTPFEVI